MDLSPSEWGALHEAFENGWFLHEVTYEEALRLGYISNQLEDRRVGDFYSEPDTALIVYAVGAALKCAANAACRQAVGQFTRRVATQPEVRNTIFLCVVGQASGKGCIEHVKDTIWPDPNP